ncbi:Pyridoxamine 5'-phosphate oxidase [Prochlorococcus sp. MIT 0702]|nr:Pyridoxamine 5'-phosphate oxidase [Prochlorococcus sp. MIT 0701]KGG26393.1 Pyridoxamine 5'-phosphate oxidase [Prochlorococcus sp. MIT 0702]KGG31187.1 Pyridoxamine 5'-phosphate oxidase [Prochlorococcus sp. MIT 0703]
MAKDPLNPIAPMGAPSPDQDIAALRRNYQRASLRSVDLDADPVEQFRRWLQQAIAADLQESTAMVLSTFDGKRPSSRTVLLKAFDKRGFVFFTNYGSRKAQEISAHPNVSLLFPWYGLERQVAIMGPAERISTAESQAYFSSRPFGSRLGVWVSQQSQVISSRQILEMKWQEIQRRFANGEVPLPEFWGGFRVAPIEFEFWQGRENRLNDRFRYRPQKDSNHAQTWRIERLAP